MQGKRKISARQGIGPVKAVQIDDGSSCWQAYQLFILSHALYGKYRGWIIVHIRDWKASSKNPLQHSI